MLCQTATSTRGRKKKINNNADRRPMDHRVTRRVLLVLIVRLCNTRGSSTVGYNIV